MPRVLEELPKTTRSNSGRHEKYPFDEWFDGNIYELVQGEDFESKRTTMATVIHSAATKRDLVATTRMTEDGIAIQVRPATDEDRERREKISERRAAAKAAAEANGEDAGQEAA